MCDNCSNPNTVKSICINKYCIDVYKILNAASENDIKFTGMSLVKKLLKLSWVAILFIFISTFLFNF